MKREDLDKAKKEALDEAMKELRATIAANLQRLRGADDPLQLRGKDKPKSKPRIAQERLALDAGLDRTLVSKLERGVSSPSLETLVKLAQVLDVPVDELLRKK